MSEAKGPDEPSMEEILSSIRKIINEDDAAAEASALTAVPELASAPRPAPPPPPESQAADGDDEDDVLELTEMVADDPKPQTPPQPAPAPVPAQADLQGGGIMSDSAARAAAGSFAQLSHAMRPKASAPPTEAAPVGGGQTIEAMAIEILRPMLRDWVDENLPQMVERLVSQEIRRMTGGG